MSRILGTLFLLCLTTPTFAQVTTLFPEERYKVAENVNRYPQKTPQETLKSIGNALNNKDLVYLMAWLADHKYVDKRVNQLMVKFKGGSEEERALVAFEELVKEISAHFEKQPSLVRELRTFVVKGKWNEKISAFEIPGLQSRRVFLKKDSKDRWMLQNRQR